MNTIRQSFNRAAPVYTATARLQQLVADHLLTLVRQQLPEKFNGRLLDAGCGTGYCLQHLEMIFPTAFVTGLDFAESMLRELRAIHRNLCINADIEDLPVADNSIDAYISSLAWQWCNPVIAARECQRILRSQGQLLIATLSTGTFSELANCLEQLDLAPHQHLLRFSTPEVLIHALTQAGLTIEHVDRRTRTTWHTDFKTLRHSIRGVGANHLPGKNAPSLNRAQRSALIDAYEALRTPQGLPLSYDVLTIAARKCATN